MQDDAARCGTRGNEHEKEGSMRPEPSNPAGGDPARSVLAGRERLEALGQVSAELLHDLADAVYSMEQRTLLAAEEARRGRSPFPDLDRAVEAGTEMRAMLRDVMDVLRGSALSPEVMMDPRMCVERALRRFVAATGPVDVRLVCDLPPGTTVPGRESFLSRLAANLLAGAARRARARVLLELRLELEPDGRAGVVLGVEDDGRAPSAAGGSPAPHPRPSSSDEWRPGVVAWLVAQLGGEVRPRAVCMLGGSGLEIRLPANVP
jgi:signal transduction histidine kinase